MRTRSVLGLLVAATLVVAACGDDDEETSETVAPADSSSAGDCAKEGLPLKTAGTLTVATGEPAFEPWVVGDDPTSGEGFEAALVYAVAEQLGFDQADVIWIRTGFEEVVAPGAKDFDFNVQQYSITPERAEVVDFSDGYYEIEQALVARADSPFASATSLAELKDAKLGAAIGTTSLDYAEEVIAPSSEVAVYDDNAAAKAAFDANQVDALVFDLPTAYFITAVEIPDATIVGVLPVVGETETLGALFEKGSPLVPCVNQALATLRDSGELDALAEQYLNQGGSIPTLSQ